MHGELMAEQRAQVGCSLLHLTFEAAQESHEALSFKLLVFLGADVLGAEVGEDMLSVVVLLSIITGERQRNGRDVIDIIFDYAVSFEESVSGRGKLSVVLPTICSQDQLLKTPPPLYINERPEILALPGSIIVV
jgi:hypothetical protein